VSFSEEHLCQSGQRRRTPPARAVQRGVGKTEGFHTTKWPGKTLSGATYASVPCTHALLTAGGILRALRERPSGTLHTPMRPSKMDPPVGPERPFAYNLEISVHKYLN